MNSEEYCIYLRKSRADMEAEAHGEGETLARHEKLLLELAKRKKITITQIYREIVSGDTIAARPVMQQLLQEVQDGRWADVLVVEVERLARGDTIDQGIVAQTFTATETKIITPLKDYDPTNEFDEEYFEFGLFMSRREYKAINRRLIRGREAASKEGKFVNSTAPYGYKRVRVESGKGWTLEIVPDEAEMVRLIYRLYTEGEPMPDGSKCEIGPKRICRILEAAHVPTPAGGRQWSGRTVEVILQNPVYIGKIRWSRRKPKRKMEDGKVEKVRYVSPDETWIISDGLHEPIISEPTFEAAAEKLARHGPVPVPLAGTIKNPFSGIAICEKCGRTLSLRSHPTYPMLKCPNRFCDNVGTGLEVFEKAVLEGLSDWLDGYRLQWDSSDPTPDDEAEQLARLALRKTENELETLKKQLTRAHELLERDIYDVETFLDRSRAISAQITKANQDIEAARSALSDAERNAEHKKTLIPNVEKLLDVYRLLPDAEAKNAMLKQVLEKVTYRRDERTGKNRPHDNFQITLYPKLPPAEGK